VTDGGPRDAVAGLPCCLAVDVGGTKIAAGLVSHTGELIASDSIRTPRASDGDALFQVVADLVAICAGEASLRSCEIEVCGVGCGGPMSAGGESVSPLNIPAWRSFALRDRLAALPVLGAVPVFVDNDAKALALGEGWVGSARGLRSFLAMVVSTGVGGGIVLDGRMLEGSSGNAGHIGHVVVEPDGRRCGCGAKGCLEAEASGTAIEEITGHPASEAPREVVERAGTLVGRAVASVANLLDLRLALVGGSVALGFGLPFFVAAQREIDERCRLAHSRGCRVEPVGLGAAGPLVGAGAVGWRGIRRLGETAPGDPEVLCP